MNHDKFHDECGIIGIYLDDPEKNAASFVYYGLLSLQHRGQESSGISVTNNGTIESWRDMGLVPHVFPPEIIEKLKGSASIGHVRYSTAALNTIENVQPFVSHSKQGSIAVALNGALTNSDVVRELLEDSGITFVSTSDCEVIMRLIAKNYKKGIERSLTDTIQFIKGSYALAVLSGDTLLGARDPAGIRPLCMAFSLFSTGARKAPVYRLQITEP